MVFDRLGLKSIPQLVVNGHPLSAVEVSKEVKYLQDSESITIMLSAEDACDHALYVCSVTNMSRHAALGIVFASVKKLMRF